MDMTDKHPFENTKQQAYEVHYYNELEKQEQRGVWARGEAYEAQICGADGAGVPRFYGSSKLWIISSSMFTRTAFSD